MANVPDSKVVFVEVPILRDWFEGWKVVVVDAPDDVRVARSVVRDDRMTESEILAIMARQPSRSEWLLAADLVIDNGGDKRQLDTACRSVWERVIDD